VSFEAGRWKAQCDRCGFDFINTRLLREWTGLRVCRGCFESRHPQEKLRGKADKQAPQWVRPQDLTQDVSVGSGNEVSAEDL
jgi:hypothetical protein